MIKSELSGYSEAGRRSTAEDYEEEDTDDDYTYQNYHLKIKQGLIPHISYDLSSFIYRKDYLSNDSLDNISRISRTRLAYSWKDPAGDKHKLNLEMKYREKRYGQDPGKGYNQLSLTPSWSREREGLYSLNLSGGLSNFDYLEKTESDQFKVMGQIEGDRYLSKNLKLNALGKIETIFSKNINREKTKKALAGEIDYALDLPWIHKIKAGIDGGERDTKEDEERDDDYDYRYAQYYAQTEHKLNSALKTNLKYQYFRKDYFRTNLDHHGFILQDRWHCDFLNSATSRISLRFEAKHKEVDYSQKEQNNYRKESAEITLTCQQKRDWKSSITLENHFYRYAEREKDKNRIYLYLMGERFIFPEALALSLNLKYRITDYRQKSDKDELSLRMAFRYIF